MKRSKIYLQKFKRKKFAESAINKYKLFTIKFTLMPAIYYKKLARNLNAIYKKSKLKCLTYFYQKKAIKQN